ncbi:MAG: hypothetical protein D6715_11060 [Calditrichaeota bacterium]|nr:MAG: hypothetical protein D6715_11060 [Calditrichota bacterium]
MFKHCLRCVFMLVFVFGAGKGVFAQDKAAKPDREPEPVEIKVEAQKPAVKVDRKFTRYELAKMKQIRQARHRAVKASTRAGQGAVPAVKANRPAGIRAQAGSARLSKQLYQKRAARVNEKSMRILKERSEILKAQKADKQQD